MPLKAYFQGHGEKVMQDFKERYGEKLGEEYFYRTANKTGMTPAAKKLLATPKRKSKKQ